MNKSQKFISIPLLLISFYLTGCGGSSDEPHKIELILPNQYAENPTELNDNESSKTLDEYSDTLNITPHQNVAEVPPEPSKPIKELTYKPPSKTSPNETKQYTTKKQGRVINVKANDTLNMRAGVGTNYRIIQRLQPNEKVTLTGKKIRPEGSKHHWIKITTQQGNTGWVNSYFIR